MSTATERDLEYTEGRRQYWQGEAERLALLVRELGGEPEPGAKQPLVFTEPFQARVQPWMMACFGEMIAGDREERNQRFLKEALELVQACGCTAFEAHQLVDYVFKRPAGEKGQEVGGVMVTLAALCLAQNLDMHAQAETELARIWTKVEQIRAKQAAKPKHSPLPVPEEADPVGALDARSDLFKLISGKLHACEWTNGAFLEPEQWELILKCLAFWSPAPAQASPVGGERYRPASTAFPPEVKEHLARRVKAIETAWLSEKHEYPEVGQVTFLLRLANAYLDLPEVQPATQERAEICRALGCVDKPGVPLQFVKDLQTRCDKQWARINELYKTWDEASLTERQELDRFRRGWGPSTPTERELRRANVASALQAVSIAMSEVSVPEEEADDISKEAHDRLDEAHDRLSHAHTSLHAVLLSINLDPQEWPDIRAAEERGAAAMRQVLLEMVGGLEIIGPNLMAAWRHENKGVAEAVSMIKLAPSPHDYEGTAREEIKATLSKVEVPVPKACAEIIDAARRLYDIQRKEAATKEKIGVLDKKIVRCSQLEEGLEMMQQRHVLLGELAVTKVAERIAQIDVSSALHAVITEPKTTEQKAA